MNTLDTRAIVGLREQKEAREFLLDLINAGKAEGSFYLNSVKTAIELNDNILRETIILLETDITLFRGYDKHISSFVKSLR